MKGQNQKPRPIYRARPDLEGNRVAALRTGDSKVLRLVPQRRWIRWGGYSDAIARRAAA
jgi:hypothetical protein